MSAILIAEAHAIGLVLAQTRRLPRVMPKPQPPGNWTDYGSGNWSWMSSGRTVAASIYVCADGEYSGPLILPIGKFRLVASEIERAMTAVQALLDYTRALDAWHRMQGDAP